MQEIERSAASVEEAIEAALAELGVSEQEATVEVLQEPRGGFLGFNAQPAVVRVRVIQAPPQMATTELDRQVEMARTFVEGLVETIGLDAEVEPSDVDGVAYVDVWGAESDEEMGILIGKHGHTVEALQELVRAHVQHATGERCGVQVDVEDYRKRRRSYLVRKADDVARRVRKTGRPEALEPMNAYERKVIHDTVGEFDGLESASEGEEPNRRVVVKRAR